MIEMQVHTWDYDDGSVGAELVDAPEGDIWAASEAILQRSMDRLIRIFVTADVLRSRGQALTPDLDIGMDAREVDGKYGVRWRDLPDFVVLFERQEQFQPWLVVLATFAKAINQQETLLKVSLN